MQNEEDKKPPVETEVDAAKSDSIVNNVTERIKDADNILVTLSRDPSVDEMAAAIGLTLMLDQMGKHATAIYSGKTPNALEFLEPKKTFETNTNSLQDFIIALNKDKADHLRYKIEDDFVKVYITPYRTTIEESDLQFSHGDINVDLVISLNVKDNDDLDAALARHGRIMHDASAINISNDTPGKLGGIEWDNPGASSVSEMIVDVIEKLGESMTEEVATALLTGVIAATERFSNQKTTPEAMEISAKLMEAGANQQLIAVNIEKTEPKAEEAKPAEVDLNIAANGSAEGAILDIARDEPKGETKDEPKQETAGEISPEQQLEQMIGGTAAGETAASVPELATPAEMPKVEEPVSSPEEVLKQTVPEVDAVPEVEPAATPVVGPAVATPVTETPAIASTAEPMAAPVVAAPVLEAPTSLPEAEVQTVAAPAAPAQLFGEQKESPVIDKQVVIPSAKGEAEAEVASTSMPEKGIYETSDDMTKLQDGTVEPLPNETPTDYGEMMEKELANSPTGPFATNSMTTPEVTGPISSADLTNPMASAEVLNPVMTADAANPAAAASPTVAAQPEVQPVTNPMVGPNNPMVGPENTMAGPENIELPQAPAPAVPGVNETMNNGETTDAALPPVQPIDVQGVQGVQGMQGMQGGMPAAAPVTMPVDESAANGVPAAPEGVLQEAPKEELNPVIVQPETNQNTVQNPVQGPIQDPASVPPVQDPGAFKIPGM